METNQGAFEYCGVKSVVEEVRSPRKGCEAQHLFGSSL